MIFDLIIFDDNHGHMVKISKFPQGMNKQQLTVPESGINHLFQFRKTLTGLTSLPLCARWINSSTLIIFFFGLQFWPKGIGVANKRKETERVASTVRGAKERKSLMADMERDHIVSFRKQELDNFLTKCGVSPAK